MKEEEEKEGLRRFGKSLRGLKWFENVLRRFR